MACLGACTVFLVVVVAATLQTLLARTPLIFLRLAETDAGQMDIMLTPSVPHEVTVNYSQIADRLLSAFPDKSLSYSAPRLYGNAVVVPDFACPEAKEASDSAPYGVGLYARMDNASMYATRGDFGVGGSQIAASADDPLALPSNAEQYPFAEEGELGVMSDMLLDARGANTLQDALVAACGKDDVFGSVEAGGLAGRSLRLVLIDEDLEDRMGLGR